MRAARVEQPERCRRWCGSSARSSPSRRTGCHLPRAQLRARRHREPVAAQQLPHRRARPDARQRLLLLACQHSTVPVDRLGASVERGVPDAVLRRPEPGSLPAGEGRPRMNGERAGASCTMPACAASSTRARARSSRVWTLSTSPCATPFASTSASSRSRGHLEKRRPARRSPPVRSSCADRRRQAAPARARRRARARPGRCRQPGAAHPRGARGRASAMTASRFSTEISGPTSVAGSSGSPTWRARSAATISASKRAAMDSSTTKRRIAVQRCPAKPKAARTSSGTLRSRSASARTIAALLPPSSAWSGFIASAHSTASDVPRLEGARQPRRPRCPARGRLRVPSRASPRHHVHESGGQAGAIEALERSQAQSRRPAARASAPRRSRRRAPERSSRPGSRAGCSRA